MHYDLLLKGGKVIDPIEGDINQKDVAVVKGRIYEIKSHLPADSAFRVVDVSGKFVSPGLIDFHAHVYDSVTYQSINADVIGSHTGVTTWIDAGTAGAVTFPGLRKYVIEQSKVRILAFVNISYIGLVAIDYELANIEYCDTEILKRVVNLNRDVVVGINCMEKMLCVGMPMVDVFRAVTLKPAQILGRSAEIGSFKRGVHADISVFDIEEGNFGLKDVHGNIRYGQHRINHCMTFIEGRDFKPSAKVDFPPWFDFVDDE